MLLASQNYTTAPSFMLHASATYLRATRHPWACMLFVLPLLCAYEFGLVLLDSENAHLLRNGADTWLHWLFASAGLRGGFWAPGLVGVLLLAWGVANRRGRPAGLTTLAVGIALESALFALGLWSLSRLLLPILDRLMFEITATGHTMYLCRVPGRDPVIEQTIGFIGAGVYEETIFRLVLFSGLVWLLTSADMPRGLAVAPAAFASAVAFAAAHHLGPHGESYEGFVFLFRTVAGLYFALLYHFRGFGVAVGTHTFYDLFVGVCFK